MKLWFEGDLAEIDEGVGLLAEELDFSKERNGFLITVKKRPGNLNIVVSDDAAKIEYSEKSHFFRGLNQVLGHLKQDKKIEIEEVPQFKSCGAMLDASRNGVLKVEKVKFLLRKMATMGFNQLMMYTEDTYEVKELPYFGYMRGRYTSEEIREMDSYAQILGIEMIPCIQTLAHLREALKWEYADDIRDTDDILLLGEEKTYDFLNKIISSAIEPYRTNRIHIGMDEAHELGLGRYLDKNDYTHRYELMNQHLTEVTKITDNLQLKPMIWSDMYFTLGSEKNTVYDPDALFPSKMVEQIPDVQLVYWNYYQHQKEEYINMFNKHMELKKDIIFAGGIWTWNGIVPNYSKTWFASNAGLQAAKEVGIKEVFATMWGDNGQETSLLTVLPGLQLFAEHAFSRKIVKEKIKTNFKFCTDSNLDDFLIISKLDEVPSVSKYNLNSSMTAKVLLWQDLLIGLYDKNIEGLPLNNYYNDLTKQLEIARDRNKNFYNLFDFYAKLAKVLSIKAELGIQLKEMYIDDQKEKMKKKIQTIHLLKEEVNILRIAHRTLWLDNNKPFGWEVLDIRYGGLLSRIETTIYRLTTWVEGGSSNIEELDAKRLLYKGPYGNPEGTIGNALYHRIVTASAFSN